MKEPTAAAPHRHAIHNIQLPELADGMSREAADVLTVAPSRSDADVLAHIWILRK